jgi:hypothetical protein
LVRVRASRQLPRRIEELDPEHPAVGGHVDDELDLAGAVGDREALGDLTPGQGEVGGIHRRVVAELLGPHVRQPHTPNSAPVLW